jgi:hypothetical protein
LLQSELQYRIVVGHKHQGNFYLPPQLLSHLQAEMRTNSLSERFMTGSLSERFMTGSLDSGTVSQRVGERDAQLNDIASTAG